MPRKKPYNAEPKELKIGNVTLAYAPKRSFELGQDYMTVKFIDQMEWILANSRNGKLAAVCQAGHAPRGSVDLLLLASLPRQVRDDVVDFLALAKSARKRTK